MTPWVISHDLMRANEEQTIRATRYAHHRAHTYRRPGRLMASLLRAWTNKLAIPARANTAPMESTSPARDPLCLTVSGLGIDDTGGAPYPTIELRQPKRVRERQER